MIRKIFFHLGLLGCLLNGSFLFSIEIMDFLKNSTFAVGPEYVYVNLHNRATEFAPATKFKGSCWGGTATYEYKQANSIYANVNGYYVKSHSFRGNHEKRHFSDIRLEFRLGHVFVLDCEEKWKLTPYVGFGYGRIVQSHITPTVLGGPHLRTKTPTYYVPVGAILSYAINANFIVSTNIRWTPQVDALFETSAIKHGRWKLKNKDGWVVEFPLVYHQKYCEADYSLTLAPYWRVLNKGSGTTINTACAERPIARQRYNFYGVKLLFGVSF